MVHEPCLCKRKEIVVKQPLVLVLENVFSCRTTMRWHLSRLSLRRPHPGPNKIFENEDDDEYEDDSGLIRPGL